MSLSSDDRSATSPEPPAELPPPAPEPGPVVSRPGTVVNPPGRPTAPAVPRTRTSAVWFGIWAGAAVLVLLIIFIAQNTGKVEITFLWMHGTIPLALALLSAGVGVAVIAMGVAAARIAQLRRLLRRRR
jgi:uncharacterized integral membrane protein